MSQKEKLWGGVILIVLLVGYILPYTLLSNVTQWSGSFLLWVILALLIILINYLLTKDWGE